MIITSKAKTTLFFGYLGELGLRLEPGASSPHQDCKLYAERHVQLDISEGRIDVSFKDDAERDEAHRHLAASGAPPPWLRTHIPSEAPKTVTTVPDKRATEAINPPKPPVIDPFKPLVDVPERREAPRVPPEVLKAVRETEARKAEIKKAEKPAIDPQVDALNKARAEAMEQANAAIKAAKAAADGTGPKYTPETVRKMGANRLIDTARELGLNGMDGMSAKELRDAIITHLRKTNT